MSTDSDECAESPSATEADDYVQEESEDDSEYEDGVKGRISGFNQPKISSGSTRPSKRQRIFAPKQAKGKGSGKGKGKGRNSGKLAQLVNMPLDVFFEITSQLEPLDILQLSRVSKRFRSTFASRGSRHVWVAARKNIPDMPNCPDDLTEPQYASLMFEHNCQACGKPRAHKTDYSLRVRFCGPCFKTNIKKGSTIMRPYRKVPETVLTLLPRSLTPRNYFANSSVFQAKKNSTSNYYYVSELEMVIRRWQELEHDKKALQLFEKRQLAVASDIMDNAITLNDWVCTSKREKNNDDSKRSVNREISIKEKLAVLGYVAEDYPYEWDGRWSALVNQPRELTPRIWKIIQPKLEALIEEERARKLEVARKDRLTVRAGEFKPFWETLVLEITNAQENIIIPTFTDAQALPAVAELLAEGDAHEIVTEERFLARKDAILAAIPGYQVQIKRELVKICPPLTIPTQDQSSNEEPDFSILNKASTLFRCPGAWTCKVLLPYPDIFFHEHVRNVLGTFVSFHALIRLRPNAKIWPMAIQLLKTLGLAEDTPASALTDLKGRFICHCGHPGYQKPMDFGALVNHLVIETDWYDMVMRQRNPRKGEDVFMNDHDLTIPEPCVALLAPDDSLSCGDDENENGEATDSNDDFGTKFCLTCWRSAHSYSALRSEADVAYHMRAKHLKEASEGDAATSAELLL